MHTVTRLGWIASIVALVLLPRCVRWEHEETSDLSPCWGLPCGECQSNTACGWDALDAVCRARNQFPDRREATRARCAMTTVDAGATDHPVVDVPAVDTVESDTPMAPRARVRVLNATTRPGGLDVCFVREGSSAPIGPLLARAGRAVGVERGWRSTPLAVGEPGTYAVTVVASGQPCDAPSPIATSSVTWAAAVTYTLVVQGSSVMSLAPGVEGSRVGLRFVNGLAQTVSFTLDVPPMSPVERWPDTGAGEVARRMDSDADGFTYLATTTDERRIAVRQGTTRIATNLNTTDLSMPRLWTVVTTGVIGSTSNDDEVRLLRVDERIETEAALTVPARL